MHIIDLSGRDWRVRQAGEQRAYPATVPGAVYNDLLNAGAIEDPFAADNELRLRWIGAADWIYERDFEVDAATLAMPVVLLQCEGLDTLAEIRVNGSLVGTADNMHRRWEFSVRPWLRSGANQIEVTFRSALAFVQARNETRKLPGWMGGVQDDAAYGWIRKEACNFGWDWGPRVVTCGIWRPIRIVAIDTARILDVYTEQRHERDGSVTLKVEAAIQQVDEDAVVHARINLQQGGGLVASTTAIVDRGRLTHEIRVPNPALWYPAGLGPQPLYRIEVELTGRDGRSVDRWSRRIGLRTLRLECLKDEWGESFRFVANGTPFFAKGANWIPPEAVRGRATRADYERLLNDARAAHMNMMRVWGGGVFEEECFYDLCDELGIVVWQDFLFACSTYPTFDPDWMANVRAEAEDNVRRLRHHACLALWCGNNELEAGLVFDEWGDRWMSWADYNLLFEDLLPRVVRALDPTRDYIPSSPFTPGARKEINNPNAGDAHLWDVWHQKKPFEWYRTAMHRFCSEFGFQSFPEPRTVEGYIRPEDRNISSYMMDHHQRSGIGNATIMMYMVDWFLMPKGFEETLWLSQILQGLGIKYAVEHWRRNMPRCMGALYWQLNDCWPVASWASIDYHGRWKALHYFARRFFAPVMLSLVERPADKKVEVHVTSDRLIESRGEVKIDILDVAGSVLSSRTVIVLLKAQSSQLIETVDLAEAVATAGERRVLVHAAYVEKDAVVSSDSVGLVKPKHLELEKPVFSTEVTSGEDGGFAVRVSADKVALYTWLALDGADARWSDNFFHLVPGQPATITCKPVGEIGLEEVRRQIVVRSLCDTF